MEASALQAPAPLAPTRTLRAPLLRLRSDEQLVALFRAGHDEAFRVIHDRYRQRLFAYTRQMLPRRQDAEDALQDVFVRAYSGLRASDRDLALRAWLYRVAHNRCIDELRRPPGPPAEVLELIGSRSEDPVTATVQRDAFRRLLEDVRRLPDHQRSALLMRELGGMSYSDMAQALGVSVPAVKSLLVRARIALAQALAARDTACSEIRRELTLAHDQGVRASSNVRRHLRDCPGCREFRKDLRGASRQLAALGPGIGPLGLVAKLLGIGGGASGGTAAASGAASTGGAAVSAGALTTGVTHVATLLAATVVTAGGAVEIQTAISAPAHHPRRAPAAARAVWPGAADPVRPTVPPAQSTQVAAVPVTGAAASLPRAPATSPPTPAAVAAHAPKAKPGPASGSPDKAVVGAPAGWGGAWGTSVTPPNDAASGGDATASGLVTGTDPTASGTDPSGLTTTTSGPTDGTAGSTPPGAGGSQAATTTGTGTPAIGSATMTPVPGSAGANPNGGSPTGTS